MSTPFPWKFLVLSACLALVAHLLPTSTYSSPEMMDAYFGGENTPGSWKWESVDGSWTKDYEPFKYRLVFRGLVDSVANFGLALGAERDLYTYWMAYLTISTAVHTFALYACYLFLQTLGLKLQWRLAGVVAWALLPPILFPYSYPVQTKEDFIAYGLIFLALRAMLTGRWWQVVLICFAGAFVRETLLMIAGLFLLGSEAPRRLKIAALALPIMVHVLLRTAMDINGYEVFRSTNLNTPLLPVVALVFIFGYAWVPLAVYMTQTRLLEPLKRDFAPSLLQRSNRSGSVLDDRLTALRHAFPYALIVLLAAHFLMGRVQEIRITCLLSPFVLLALFDMFRGRYFTRETALTVWAASSSMVALLLLFEMTGGATSLRVFLNPMLEEFALPLWWAVAYLQLILLTGLLSAYLATQDKPLGRAKARPSDQHTPIAT